METTLEICIDDFLAGIEFDAYHKIIPQPLLKGTIIIPFKSTSEFYWESGEVVVEHIEYSVESNTTIVSATLKNILRDFTKLDALKCKTLHRLMIFNGYTPKVIP